MLPTSGLLVPGLSSLAGRYDGILCDVWGVIHNGVSVFAEAAVALQRFRATTGGAVVLITNAPRPSPPIIEQLDALGFDRAAYDDVVTSGDVTAELMAAEQLLSVFHIGPERDQTLFDDLAISRVAAEDTDTIVCTGLYDDVTETPEDYRQSLAAMADRGMRMICANPDIVVERGTSMIYCAGALAALYESLGGPVVRLGKPFAPIYRAARDRLGRHCGRPLESGRILAIGDGMFTDIKGANAAGLDALFVTGGIHSDDFGELERPDPRRVAERLAGEGLKVAAAIPKLRW